MTYDADVSFAKYQAIMDMHNIPKAHIVFWGEGGARAITPTFLVSPNSPQKCKQKNAVFCSKLMGNEKKECS